MCDRAAPVRCGEELQRTRAAPKRRATMPYDRAAVMHRDQRTCRFRFTGCRRRATEIVLDVPEYLGGTNTDANARAACRQCAKQQLQQRNRAAELFGHLEDW